MASKKKTLAVRKVESPYARLDKRFSALSDAAMGAMKEVQRVDIGTYPGELISATDLRARVDTLQRLGFHADLKIATDGITIQAVRREDVKWWEV